MVSFIYRLYWYICTFTVWGGGLYMCMCSSAGESSVFQNAVFAVRAHVPVLAWDRMFLQGEEIKIY